jgi:hypothetical protein
MQLLQIAVPAQLPARGRDLSSATAGSMQYTARITSAPCRSIDL